MVPNVVNEEPLGHGNSNNFLALCELRTLLLLLFLTYYSFSSLDEFCHLYVHLDKLEFI